MERLWLWGASCAGGDGAPFLFTLGLSELWNSCEITTLRDTQKLSGHSPELELNHAEPRAVLTSGTP